MVTTMGDSFVMHPGLVLILGAVLIAALKGKVRDLAVLLVALLALTLVWRLPQGDFGHYSFLGHALTAVHSDAMGRLFALIFTLMAVGGGLYALTQKSRLEVPAAFAYAGSAIGVVLAGDLVTLFVFWELMAVASTLVLWSQGSEQAYRAARRYLMVHLAGGVILFAGVTGHILDSSSVTFTAMRLDSPAHWLMLLGFLINAGAPPLSAWLPDAYPEASWSGTVFLSAFTTKTAVYVLMRGFPGTELLIWLGLFMVFYGIVYALLENDMRRLLAFSIVSQVGFMLVAIGIGTEMALNGAAAHAFAHILYKGLLLMALGSVLRMTGKRRLSELGGLYRSMPLTATCAVVGAMAISAFPLTSGFVTKSMVVQAAANEHLATVWLLLTAASAGTFFYVGMKLPWMVFFGPDARLRPAEPAPSMRLAMVLFALLCLGLGMWETPLYSLLPFPVNYEPYTTAHVVAQLQLLAFAGLAFVLVLPSLRRQGLLTLDWDALWRKVLPTLVGHLTTWLKPVWQQGNQGVRGGLARVYSVIMHEQPAEVRLGSTWSVRSMATWVLVLLLGYLVLYFF
jgi:multicomponent Na+:H+ antiporter subunit D